MALGLPIVKIYNGFEIQTGLDVTTTLTTRAFLKGWMGFNEIGDDIIAYRLKRLKLLIKFLETNPEWRVCLWKSDGGLRKSYGGNISWIYAQISINGPLMTVQHWTLENESWGHSDLTPQWLETKEGKDWIDQLMPKIRKAREERAEVKQ